MEFNKQTFPEYFQHYISLAKTPFRSEILIAGEWGGKGPRPIKSRPYARLQAQNQILHFTTIHKSLGRA